MKNLLLIFSLFVLCLSACKKEVIEPGKPYHVKGGVFSKGAYQPVQPVQVFELYTDPLSGLPFAHCKAYIDWRWCGSAYSGWKRQDFATAKFCGHFLW